MKRGDTKMKRGEMKMRQKRRTRRMQRKKKKKKKRIDCHQHGPAGLEGCCKIKHRQNKCFTLLQIIIHLAILGSFRLLLALGLISKYESRAELMSKVMF